MPKHHNQTPVWGIILVAIGLFFLMKTFDFFILHWSLLLAGAGIVFIIFAFTSEDKGVVFPGSLLLMLGLFFYLRFHGILDDPMFLMWPIFPTIVGAAFLILYIFKPADWGLLIPAGILLFFGVFSFAYEYDFLRWNPAYIIRRYWPLILIVIGAKLLVSSRKKEQ